jgi:Domain of unknown function (DUF6089)
MRFLLQGSSFRRLLGAIFLLVIVIEGNAQISQRSELGFGLGTFNYTGDLVRSYDFAFSKPAATVIYRVNLSKVVSLRTSLTGGKLGASDKAHSIDAFAAKRAASFNIFLMELSGAFEYHFLDWREEKRKLRFTPYAFAGIGLFSIAGNGPKNAEYSNVQMAIPFGVGMKYVLNPKWYLALEAGIRKTFFDYLDNISYGNPKIKNYHYGSGNDYDNYFFFGIILTRTFYDIPCPKNPYH